jgi:hypoxanthine phosphoribosyltransferase
MKFISPSWNSIFSQTIDLAQKIRYDENKLGKARADAIVGVSRGGLVLARLMSDLMNIDNVLITKSEYYTGMGKRNAKPQITQEIQRDLAESNVLLVDDVSDTGESLVTIKEHILSKRPRSLTVATLYLKPWSKSMPDYFVSKTDAWIVFPWEYYESWKLLNSKGGSALVSRSGIPKNIIERMRRYDEVSKIKK